MKQKLSIILIVLALIIAGGIILYLNPSAPAPAQVATPIVPTPEIEWTEPEGKFKFTLPANWDITVTKEGIFVVAPADKSAVIAIKTAKTTETLEKISDAGSQKGFEMKYETLGTERAAVGTKLEGDMQVTTIAAIRGNIVYHMTVSIDTTKSNKQGNVAAYEKIRSSFVFLK